MGNGNAKVTISFQGVFNDLEKSLDKVDRKMSALGINKSAAKQFADLTQKIDNLEKKTEALSNEKINSGNFISYAKDVNKQVTEITKSTELMKKVIQELVDNSSLHFTSTNSGKKVIEELNDALGEISTTAVTTKDAINEISAGNLEALKQLSVQLQKTGKEYEGLLQRTGKKTYTNKSTAKKDILTYFEEVISMEQKIQNSELGKDLFSDDIGVRENAIKSVTEFVGALTNLDKALANVRASYDETDKRNNAFYNSIISHNKTIPQIEEYFAKLIGAYNQNGFSQLLKENVDDLNQQVTALFRDLTQINFEDNSLKVPIKIENASTLLGTVKKLVASINDKLKDTPIEIQLNLTSQWGTRQYNKALKELNEKINNISGSKKAKQQLEELQGAINNFANTYGDVIKIRIDESYYDALEKGRKALTEMRQVAGKALVVDISKLNVSKEVVEKFKEQFTKLAGGIDLAVKSVNVAEGAKLDSSIEQLFERTINNAVNNAEKNILLNKAVNLPTANNLILQALGGIQNPLKPNFDDEYFDALKQMATNSIELSEAIKEIAKSLSTVNSYFSNMSGKAISPLDKLIEKLNEIVVQIQNIGKSLTGINPVSQLSTIQGKVDSLISDVNKGLNLGTKEAKERIRDIISSYSVLLDMIGETRTEDVFGKLNFSTDDKATQKVLKSLNNNWKNKDTYTEQAISQGKITLENSIEGQLNQLIGITQNIYSYLTAFNRHAASMIYDPEVGGYVKNEYFNKYKKFDNYGFEEFKQEKSPFNMELMTYTGQAYKKFLNLLQQSSSEEETIKNTLRGIIDNLNVVNNETKEIGFAANSKGIIDRFSFAMGNENAVTITRGKDAALDFHSHGYDRKVDNLLASMGDFDSWMDMLFLEANDKQNFKKGNGHVLQKAIVAAGNEAIQYDFSNLIVGDNIKQFQAKIEELKYTIRTIMESVGQVFDIPLNKERTGFDISNIKNPEILNKAYDYMRSLLLEELNKHKVATTTMRLDDNGRLLNTTDTRILSTSKLDKSNIEAIRSILEQNKEIEQLMSDIAKGKNYIDLKTSPEEFKKLSAEEHEQLTQLSNTLVEKQNRINELNKQIEQILKGLSIKMPESSVYESLDYKLPDNEYQINTRSGVSTKESVQHTVAEAKEMAEALRGNKFLTKEQAESLEKITNRLEYLKNPGTPSLEKYVKQLEELTEAAQKAEEATKNFRDPEHIGQTITNAQNFFKGYEKQFGTFLEDSMTNNKGSFTGLFKDENGNYTTLSTSTKNGTDFDPASIKETGYDKFAKRYIKKVKEEIEESRLLLEQEANNIDDADIPAVVRQRLEDALGEGFKQIREVYTQYRRGKNGEDFKAYKFKYDNGMTEIFGYDGQLLQRNSSPVGEIDKALASIKELKKYAEEYYTLQGKAANGTLTAEETSRLEVLTEKWIRLNNQIEESQYNLHQWGVESETLTNAWNKFNSDDFENYVSKNTSKAFSDIQTRLVALNDSAKGFTPEYQEELLKARESIKEINRLMMAHHGTAWEEDEEDLKIILGLLNQIQTTTSKLSLKESTLVPTGEVDKLIGKLKGTNFEKLALPFNQKKQMQDMIDYLEKVKEGGTEAAEALEKAFGIKIDAKSLSQLDASQIKKIAESVNGMVAATKGVDEGFFSRFGSRLKSTNMQFITMMFSFYDWIRYARQALSVVQEFDKALTTISFTMNTTTKQLNGMAQQSIDMAKELGTTTDQVLSVAQIYANMQSSSEEIMERAKPTVMLSTASGLDTSTVSDYLQAVENEFEMSASDAEHIADVYESISANIAMDFGKGIGVIAEGTQVSGQLAHEAGMSFEQFAAIIAKTAETTRQSGSVIGNAWKTIISRLTKSGSMSEEVDPETLSASAQSLAAIGIQVYDNMGKFRELETILGELSAKWDSLSDAQQANIAYNVAGIRNRNQFAVALKSYASAAELAAKTTEDVGIAEKNAEKYADSLAGKMGTLKATAQGLGFNLLDSNTVKNGIDLIQVLLNGIDLLTDKIGALPVITSALGGMMTAKNIGILGNNFLLKYNQGILGNMWKSDSNITRIVSDYNNGLIDTTTTISELSRVTGRAESDFQQFFSTTERGNVSIQGMAYSVNATTGEIWAARIATLALNAAIMVGVGAAVATIYKIATAEKDMAEASQKASDAIRKTENSIQSHKEKIAEAQKVLSDSNASYEDQYNARKQVYEIQQDMIKAYGEEAPVIDTLTGKINEEAKAWENVAQKEYEAQKRKMDYGDDTSVIGKISQGISNFLQFRGTQLKLNPGEFLNELSSFTSANPIGMYLGMYNSFNSYKDLKLNSQRQTKIFEEEIANLKKITPEIQSTMSQIGLNNEEKYNAFELKDKLDRLKDSLETKGIELSDAFKESLEKSLSNVESDIANFGDFYLDTAKYNISKNDELNTIYQNLETISKDYQDAVAKADTQASEDLAEKFVESFNEAMAKSKGDIGIQQFMKNTLDSNLVSKVELKESAGKFTQALQTNRNYYAGNVSDEYVKNTIIPEFAHGYLEEYGRNAFNRILVNGTQDARIGELLRSKTKDAQNDDEAIQNIRDYIISVLDKVYDIDIQSIVTDNSYGILTDAIDKILWGDSGTFDRTNIKDNLDSILQASATAYQRARFNEGNTAQQLVAKLQGGVSVNGRQIYDTDLQGIYEASINGATESSLINEYGKDAVDTYKLIADSMALYNMTLEQSIALLKEQGLLTSKIKEDAKNKFTRRNGATGEIMNQDVLDWINTLNDEQLKLLMTLDIDNTQSKEIIQKALEMAQKEADAHPIEFSYTSFNTDVNNVKAISELYKQITEGVEDHGKKQAAKLDLDSLEGIRSTFDSLDIGGKFKEFEDELLRIEYTVPDANEKLKQTEQVFDDLADSIGSAILQEHGLSLDNIDIVQGELAKAGLVETTEGDLKGLAKALDETGMKFKQLRSADEETILSIIGIGNASIATGQNFNVLSEASDRTRFQLYNLYLQENGLLDTNLKGWSLEQAQSLLELAQSAGAAEGQIALLSGAVGSLQKVKKFQEEYERTGSTSAKLRMEIAQDDALAKQKAYAKEIQNIWKITAPPDTSTTSGGGGSGTDQTKEQISLLEQLNKELDEIQDTYSKLADTVEYYNENGKITVDQFQEISNMGLQFLSYLSDENGQLKLNEEAFKDLAKAKVDEIKIELTRQAINTIESLKTEAEATEFLAYANKELRDETLSANEALLQRTYLLAKAKGGKIGEAADMAMKSWKVQMEMADKIDYSNLRPTDKHESVDHDKDKEEKEYGISKDLQAQISRFKGQVEIEEGLEGKETQDITSKIFEKVYDWIEKALDKLERDVKKWEDTIDDFFNWINKRVAIERTYNATQIELDKTYQAVIDYQKYLNKIPLEKKYKDKIQGKGWGIEKVAVMSVGTKDFVDYNSAAAEWEERDKNIQEYEQFYSKLLEEQDKMLELYRKEKDLIFKKLEIITEYYDAIQGKLQSISSSLDAQIAAKEARGESATLADVINQFGASLDILNSEIKERFEYDTGISLDTQNNSDTAGTNLLNAEIPIEQSAYYKSLKEMDEAYQYRFDMTNNYTELLKSLNEDLREAKKEKDEELVEDLKADIAYIKNEVKTLKLTGKDKKEWNSVKSQLTALADMTETTVDDVLYQQNIARAKELQNILDNGGKLTGKERSEYNKLKKIPGIYDSVTKTVLDTQASRYDNLATALRPLSERLKRFNDAMEMVDKLQDDLANAEDKEEKKLIKEDIKYYQQIAKENKLNASEKKTKAALEAQMKALETVQSIGSQTLDNNVARSATYAKLVSDWQTEMGKEKPNTNKLQMLSDTIKAVNENIKGATTENIADFVDLYQKWWKLYNDPKKRGKTQEQELRKQIQEYYDASDEYLEGLKQDLYDARLADAYDPYSLEKVNERTNRNKNKEIEELRKKYAKQEEQTMNEYQSSSEYQKIIKAYNKLRDKMVAGVDEAGQAIYDETKLSLNELKKLRQYELTLEELKQGATLGNIAEYQKAWQFIINNSARDEKGNFLRDSQGNLVKSTTLIKNKNKSNQYDDYLALIDSWNEEKDALVQNVTTGLNDALEELETKYEQQMAENETAVAEAQEKLWSNIKTIAEYSITQLQRELDLYEALISKANSITDILTKASLKRIKLLDIEDLFGLKDITNVTKAFKLRDEYLTGITTLKLKGNRLSQKGKLYEDLISATSQKDFHDVIASYKEQEDVKQDEELMSLLDNVEKHLNDVNWDKNSWLTEWNNALAEVQSSLSETVVQVDELYAALRENVYFKAIHDAIEMIDLLNERISSSANLIDDMWVRDKNGITAFGYAKVNQLASELENAYDVVSLRLAERNEVERMYANGDYNGDEEAYKKDLLNAQKALNEALGNTKSIEMEIYNIAQEAAEAEINNIKKIIDLQKDALQSKRDYYEYDKTVKEQSNDVKKIEAQIAALENVQTAEAKAKVAQLQSDLKEAQDTLADTKMEHLFDLEAKALDDFIIRLEETLDTSNMTIEETFEKFKNDVFGLIEAAKDIYASPETTNLLNQMYSILSGREGSALTELTDAIEEQNEIKTSEQVLENTEIIENPVVDAALKQEDITEAIEKAEEEYNNISEPIPETEPEPTPAPEPETPVIEEIQEPLKPSGEQLLAMDELRRSIEQLSKKETEAEIEAESMKKAYGKQSTQYQNANENLNKVRDKLELLHEDLSSIGGGDFTISVSCGQRSVHVNGRRYAFASGQNQALVGELGGELRVNPHTGRYDMLGAHGAEFRNDIHKDDIIFDANQTKALLKNGHIHSRGKAFAKGTSDPLLSRLLRTDVMKSHALDYSVKSTMAKGVEGRAFANGTVSNVNNSTVTEVNINYDSLLTVNGAVDATVVSDVQKLLKQSYQYTKKQLTSDLRKVGVV